MFSAVVSFEESVAALLAANPRARAVFDRYSFQSGLSGQYPMVRVFGAGIVHDVHTLPIDDEAAERVAELVREHNGRRESDASEFVTVSSGYARIDRAVQVVESDGASELLLTVSNPCGLAIGALVVSVAAPAFRRFHGGVAEVAFNPRHASDNFELRIEENDTLSRVELDLLWPGQNVEITLTLEPLRHGTCAVRERRE